jgi:hypothetical protein
MTNLQLLMTMGLGEQTNSFYHVIKHPNGRSFYIDLSASTDEHMLAEIVKQAYDTGHKAGEKFKINEIRKALAL